jgi:hypothetical protein
LSDVKAKGNFAETRYQAHFSGRVALPPIRLICDRDRRLILLRARFPLVRCFVRFYGRANPRRPATGSLSRSLATPDAPRQYGEGQIAEAQQLARECKPKMSRCGLHPSSARISFLIASIAKNPESRASRKSPSRSIPSASTRMLIFGRWGMDGAPFVEAG